LDGRPGLRVEARFLPAGPTVADEVASSALFLGLVVALVRTYGDVRDKISFDDVKTNFFRAARYGLNSQIVWLDGRNYPARDLVLDILLPIAADGLRAAGVDDVDVDKYLGLVRERVSRDVTGAKWMLDSLAKMDPAAKMNVRLRVLTAAMKDYQENQVPVHEWELAKIGERCDWADSYRTVEQFMSRDLFTVRPDDIIDLAASVMDWRHVRHVPVEDDSGQLVGIISHRDLIKLFAAERDRHYADIVVKDVMHTDLITVSPETRTLEALYLMRDRNIGCLPVCRSGKLVGLVTDHDFLTVSTRLFEERLKSQADHDRLHPSA
jgi:CBS domain-containing protein